MSYNGSGVYTLPGAQLANGEIVSATENNQFRNDVAAALNVAWTRDGQAPATANIPMGNHKLTGLAAGTGVGDSVRYEQFSTPPAIGNTTPNTGKFTTVEVTNNVTFPDSSTQNTAATGFGFKNRIINGAMMIDQRNAGASVTPATSGTYLVDRFFLAFSQASKFSAQQNAGSVTLPAGFKNYLGLTVASAVSIGASDFFLLGQAIEGLNVADLGWGTANAQAVTLSFKVYSSLTGTFGGSLRNNAANRFYPFSYTISSANTWTTVSVTIAGDTSGTWNTDNNIGINVYWGLGVGSTLSGTAGAWGASGYSATGATSVVGTNGATFYITGVQLEKGSTATSFDYRPYGTELALCQRYYQTYSTGAISPLAVGVSQPSNQFGVAMYLPVVMRASPAGSTTGSFSIRSGGDFAVTSIGVGGISGSLLTLVGAATSLSNGLSVTLIPTGGSGVVNFSAEL